ncbi:MAG: DUF3575 domain-containing protein [Bacteroides sp]|nr:DUF3575 domain-containing protein [Bacteroides sp.]
MKYVIWIWILLTSLCMSAQAQTTSVRSPQKRLLGIEVHFRFDKSQFDMNYMGNAQALDRFAQAVDSIGLDRIDSVVVVSQSSPEGAYKHNLNLSHNRAATMRRVVLQRHPELEKRLHVRPDGESWEGLRTYVANDKKMKQQTIDQVLRIINSDVNIETKKWRLQQLPIYRYLLQTHYPRLRNSVFCIVYFTELPPVEEPVAKLELPYERPKMNLPSFVPISIEEKKILFALKSNLLYDAMSALNVEVEIPIGDRWSVMVEDVFPWWNNGNKWALQMWEMGVEGRYWFKRNDECDVLTGWFGGVYGMSAKYDIQWKRALNYQGEYWSAGLTCGYTFPISKYFNLEFSASLGYLSTAYRHYVPSEGYDELILDRYKQGRIGYVGPTKLKVSLVVPIRLTYKKNRGAL